MVQEVDEGKGQQPGLIRTGAQTSRVIRPDAARGTPAAGPSASRGF